MKKFNHSLLFFVDVFYFERKQKKKNSMIDSQDDNDLIFSCIKDICTQC